MCLIFGFVNIWISQGESSADNMYISNGRRHTEKACTGRMQV